MSTIKELMAFLDNSLTSYHAINQMREEFAAEDFLQLSESRIWGLETGKSYFVIRNDSSMIAFRIPACDKSEIKGFHIYAAHSDSPAFKVKEKPEMNQAEVYVGINTEKYGRMILSTWMDRPLTIAGRVCMENNGKICSYLVTLKDNICNNYNACVNICPVNALEHLELEQQTCWDYAFGNDKTIQSWVINCHKCRDICPYNLGTENSFIK